MSAGFFICVLVFEILYEIFFIHNFTALTNEMMGPFALILYALLRIIVAMAIVVSSLIYTKTIIETIQKPLYVGCALQAVVSLSFIYTNV